MPTKVGTYPPLKASIHGVPGSTGETSATFYVSGVASGCRAESIEAMRAGVIARSTAIAQSFGRPVALVVDEYGQSPYRLAVRPNGIVQQLPDSNIIEDAPGLVAVEGRCRKCRRLVTVAAPECPGCDISEPLRVETAPMSRPVQREARETTQPPAASVIEIPSPAAVVTPLAKPVPVTLPPAKPVAAEQVPVALPPAKTDAAATVQSAQVPEDHTIIVPRKIRRRHIIVLTATDSTATVALDENATVGRNPRKTPERIPVPLPSPARELSREHATIDLNDDKQIVVTDLASSNGVQVIGPGAYSWVQLAPHVANVVPSGSKITLGDVTYVIELKTI